MNATLTLYFKSLINKDRNFVLDNPDGTRAIETYLTNLDNIVKNNFQYIKQGLSVTIKVDLGQDFLEMGSLNAKDLNYAKIQNGEENPMYYFVINKNWKSQSTVELELSLDSLNTFTFNDDYIVTNKTLVKRIHKDRFSKYEQHEKRHYEVDGYEQQTMTFLVPVDTNKKVDETSIDFSNLSSGILGIYVEEITDEGEIELRIDFDTGAQAEEFDIEWDYKCLRREIDIRPEEFNPTLYKTSEEEINDNTGIDWLLLYKNRNQISPTDYNQINPVDCYLIPKEDITIKVITPIISNQDIGLNGISIYPFDSSSLTIKMDNKSITLKQINGIFVDKKYIQLRLNGAQKEYRIVTTHMLSVPASAGATDYYRAGYTSWKVVNTISLATGTTTLGVWNGYPAAVSYVYYSNIWTATKYLTFTTPNVSHNITGDNIDRTDSKNIKYIALPYAPSTITKDSSGNLLVPSEWSWSESESNIQLLDIKTDFSNSFSCSSQAFSDLYIPVNTINPNENKNMLYESKLYNSNYHRNKFVYDSFSKIFELENMKDVADTTKLEIGFVPSKNMTSKFLFRFPQYALNRALEDYENIVLVGRNNDEILYNSAYINYIKNGYNYDLKAKERNQIATSATTGVQLVGAIGSVIAGIATENPIGVGAGIAMGVSFITSLISNVKTAIDNNESIDRKLEEARRQAVSVSSVDDIDLLRAYSNNKAKMCYYRPVEQVKKAIFDVFYYCGYATNSLMIPNVSSRYWFNYVQATLEFKETNNIPEYIEDDIREKFENGVTFLHCRNNTFNFEQDKENAEISLLE